VIFLLFVFFVAFVLLNLLNGLAVGDTGDIRKIAETLSLVARARLISNVFEVHEFISAFLPFKKHYLELVEEIFVLYPNKQNQLGPTELQSLLRIITKKRKLSKNGKSIEEIRIMLKKILTYLDNEET
jgi:hypothetical protein